MISSFRPATARVWQLAFVVASAVLSCTFLCVAPLAAMAAIASRTLSRTQAVLTLIAAVAVNQAAGFFVLGFPWNLSTATWAPVFVAATLAAYAVATRLAQPAIAAVAAFVSFELVLAAYTAATGESLSVFSPKIVGQLALVNLAGGAVLVAVYLGLAAAQRAFKPGSVRAVR